MEELEALVMQRVGTRVGDWSIERLLGVGAMSSVFSATRADGRSAALKLLHAHFSDVPEVRKRFLREGPLGAALTTMSPLCQGIPQVFEGGVAQDGAAYHTYGVIHRDLKPDNLHLGRDGRLMVLDFGIARVLDPLPDGVAVLPEKTATTMGVTLGTPDYMAPEQAVGDIGQIDGRTDLFGLGATLFELLSGRTIHVDLPGTQLLVAAATRPAPPLASICPELSPDVCAVVDRSLAFAKSQRYPSATVMRGDVRALRRGRTPPYARSAGG